MSKILLDCPLAEIREKLLEMQLLVENLVINALITIKDPSCGIGQNAERQDEKVNRLEEEIRDLVTRTFLLHQPVATSYRFLVATTTIIADLEHMGDSAKRICHEFGQMKKFNAESLEPLCQLVQKTISSCFRALSQLELKDIGLLEKIVRGRYDTEETCKQVFAVLEEAGARNPKEFHLQLLTAAELRRISDYAASIADQLIFYNTGGRLRFPRAA